MWIQSMQYGFTHIYILYFSLKKRENKKSKNDADIMCAIKALPVIQKSCVPHCQILIQLTTHTMVRVNHVPYQRVFGNIYMITV